jgi:hypothetical protein
VRVAEGPSGGGTLWEGAGAGTLVGPESVRIHLAPFDPFAGPGTTLTAGPDTGIVADDDGGAWVGTALPFP